MREEQKIKTNMKILNGFLNKRMGGLYHFCQVIGTYKKTAAGQKAVQPNITAPSAAGMRNFVLQRKIWFIASYKFGWAAEKLH